MKVVCIIQARMGSTRLPGKVLLKLEDKTVLQHDLDRIKQSKYIDKIIVATTKNEEDDLIVEESKKNGVEVFRGSEKDVLSRYYYAALKYKADIVVRVTSDCPCIDSDIIDNMLLEFMKNTNIIDYMNNTLNRTFPRGYDVEIMKFEVLKKAFKQADKGYEREHVTPYIYNAQNGFKLYCYMNDENISDYRVTLDTIEDYEVIKCIYQKLYKKHKYFGLSDVIVYLKNNPDVSNMNKDIKQKLLGE